MSKLNQTTILVRTTYVPAVALPRSAAGANHQIEIELPPPATDYHRYRDARGVLRLEHKPN